MKSLATLCLVVSLLFLVPVCGFNSSTRTSAPLVLSADGPIPFPPLPPLAPSATEASSASVEQPVLRADGPIPFPPLPPLSSSLA
jgi:hypothetical protein